MSETTLYERIGGDPAVSATVAKLYEKILEDDLLAPFFDDVDIDTLRRSQQAFVTLAFGGPNHYTGRGMRNAHAKSMKNGLSDKHFDAVANHLADAMRELSVPQEFINESLVIIESTRNDVLNR